MSGNNVVTLQANQSNQQGPWSAEWWTTEVKDSLKKTLAKGSTDEEFFVFMRLAMSYGLDPFKKEIYFIKRVKKIKKFVDKKEQWDYPKLPNGEIDYTNAETVIMTGRDGFLTIAKKDPSYAGLKGGVVHMNDQLTITQTLESQKVEHTLTHKDRGPIVGAWAAALHKERQPVVIFVPLSEYIQQTSTWSKNTSSMILKVAETFVLKRQFGITGLRATEELDYDLPEDGNIIDAEVVKGEDKKEEAEAPASAGESPAEPKSQPQEQPQESATSQKKLPSEQENTYKVLHAKEDKSPKGVAFLYLNLKQNEEEVKALLPGEHKPEEFVGKCFTMELTKQGTHMVISSYQEVA